MTCRDRLTHRSTNDGGTETHDLDISRSDMSRKNEKEQNDVDKVPKHFGKSCSLLFNRSEYG